MFHTIKMGLDSGKQAEVISILSREKIAHIQTSGGLCVKATTEELNKALGKTAQGLSVEKVNPSEEVPPDVRAFMES